ncbi:hypothetical protein AMR72_04135 [Flavobacterium psychrophilum]|nr:hypothetical protein AMR72_04135 [Flavobacterium psychrophilum]AOE51773.1 hypothetical protein ALW18_04130 [Flavobacterium psychrophilum]
MRVYTVLQIGHYHANYCEDYLFTGAVGNDKLVFAVMDGCTTAIDSHFISTLTGKLLRKITTEKGYQELYDPAIFTDTEYLLKSIVKDLFSEIRLIKNQLMLDPKELLTTIILMVIDKEKAKGELIVIGDGLVNINGSTTEFDHDNTPDYIGFHINEDFESWYEKHDQKISFISIGDISIATDGIFSFTKIKRTESEETIDSHDFLLTDRTGFENSEMLSLKLKKMEHENGLVPTDDFAMIRIIAD